MWKWSHRPNRGAKPPTNPPISLFVLFKQDERVSYPDTMRPAGRKNCESFTEKAMAGIVVWVFCNIAGLFC